MSQVRLDQPGDSGSRPRRRGGGTRTALVAHGEPMVWLTGGCLAISVVMILGLLWLILMQGAGTFVPQPIVKVTTVDGQVIMGEPTRHESYELVEDMVDTLPTALRDKAEPLLIESSPAGQRYGYDTRTLYRTGNFRLNNTRFTWVPEFAVVETEKPEWAMVVERQEWGRFYGIPLAFERKHERPVSEEEELLADLNQLLYIGQFTAPAEQREQIKRLLEGATKELDDLRGAAIKEFVAGFDAQEGVSFGAELDSRKIVSLTDLRPGDNVVRIVEVYEGSQVAYERFRQVHGRVLDQLRERSRLKRHDLGEINEHQEHSRKALRDVELVYGKKLLDREKQDRLEAEGEEASGEFLEFREARLRQVPLVERAESMLVQQNVLNAIELENADRAALVERVAERYGRDAPMTRAARNSDEAMVGRAEQTAEKAEAAIATVRQRLDREYARYARRIGPVDEPLNAAIDDYIQTKIHTNEQTREINHRIEELNESSERYAIRFVTGDSQFATVNVAEIVRAYPANRLSFGDKAGVYLSRWGEFLTADPREANQEGGVKQQIIGTVLMTIIMAIAVVPFGVMAALYLREYAQAGPIVSIIRISINNLAGVPSIVFGMFGYALFCRIVGGYIDRGPTVVLPSKTWFVMLVVFGLLILIGGVAALLNRGGTKTRGSGVAPAINVLLCVLMFGLVVVLNVLFGLNPYIVLGTVLLYVGCYVVFGRVQDVRSTFERTVYTAGLSTCVSAAGVLLLLIAVTPFFDGFFTASYADNNPTFGKGALIWASLTLALLTLPVVIVATEEALSAVPNSMREGSYACGAGKWQTIKRIVLPRAMPGIMTGMILAMARGAGEVAPLMLVGAVKIAPELPFDTAPPFGVNRSFLHLGFHIYDLGFQSPDAEAAKPMVYTTTLLLIFIVAVLNIASIWLRTRLRRKFVASAF